jgi:predicted phosphoribosyltransferase
MFKDRKEAAKLLAKELEKVKNKYKDPVVISIPRGGVIVGDEIAKSLNAPLDIIFVKRLEYDNKIIGSISEIGLVFLNKDLVSNIPQDELQQLAIDAIADMARERDYYKYEPIILEDKDVIIVDDGVITGASIYLTAQTIVRDKPRSITVATPIMPQNEEIISMFKNSSHHLAVLEYAKDFMSLNKWYEHFEEVSKKEVKEILKNYV